MKQSGASVAPKQPELAVTTSRGFMAWMAERHLSLGFTTYQSGKVFLLGRQPDQKLSIFERTFNRCMGMWSDGQTIWMSSLFQMWRFENVVAPGQQVTGGYDRLYVPQVGYTTGDLDIHDIAVDKNGRVVFINTLFGCLAALSETHSFVPLWKPPFLSKLAAEDRCHLNGLAMVDGMPKYVSMVSQSDVVDGWRDRRSGGGCLYDITTNQPVVEGLSMPHSVRWHEGRLWALNSGTGHLGYVDMNSGKWQDVTFCPGYLRGLAFSGPYAVVGLSTCRKNRTFSGLPLDENLRKHDAEPRCGLNVVDLRTGDAIHWLRIEGVVEELYDVVILPNVIRPAMLGFKTDEIQRTISVGDPPAGTVI